MSTITHVRFYPSDWLAGTRGMTAAETGVYITLIAMMYERAGPIREDAARLARLCGASNSAFATILDCLLEDGKIARVDGGLFNERVEKEISYVLKNSEVAASKAKSRWAKSEDKSTPVECSGIAEAMLTNSHKPNTSSLRSDVGADAPKKSAKPSPRKILETTLSPEMADGVIEHRNRMRKPLTAIAAEGLAKALSSAPDPNAAARTMIERGWQGFKLEWLANDRQRAGPSQSQNPYLAIAAELGAFGRAADYDDITQAAGPYASEPSASRYAGDLSQPRGADASNGRVLDLVAVRAVRG